MNSRLERKAYQTLLESGLLARDEIEKTFQEAEKNRESFSELLLKKKIIPEAKLLKSYAEIFSIPFVSLKTAEIPKEVLDRVPVKVAWYYHFFPYALAGKKVTIAVSRPVDVNFIDEVRFGIGMDVDVVLATRRDIEEMLHKHYGIGADTVEKILTQSSASGAGEPLGPASTAEVEDLEGLAENASVIQLVNQILLEACRKGASDIHFEPFRGKVRLRYRIDGILHEAQVPVEMIKFFNAIISRIKIMANLNIVERRMPQDGKARVKTHDQTLDLRVSCIPTPHGESLVIRILPTRMIKNLEELGFEPHQITIFQDLISRPHGIIFVTGPTGSGKSTTLYTGLGSLSSQARKIITIEDPVEYEMEGITQIQVNPEVGLTFAQGLRSVLRHDPDVMMVGEVRDLETADIAIRVALTGHLILSTLHTNDAASGVTRLLDIGVEPYLVASSVIAFMGQRLVRSICTACKEEDPDVLEEIRQMIRVESDLPEGDLPKIYRGRGCEQCNGSGFFGRTAIYEILMITEDIRHLIFQRASASEINDLAKRQGMRSMRQHGWRKVLAGITTPGEIIQATPADERPAQSERSDNPKLAARSIRITAPDELEDDGGVYVNRRAYARTAADLPLRYRPIDLEVTAPGQDAQGEGPFRLAMSEDISANGVSFSAKEEVVPGTALDLRLELPGEREEVQCIGRVVRVLKRLEPQGTARQFLYRMGVTFLAINSSDRLKLERFCKIRSCA